MTEGYAAIAKARPGLPTARLAGAFHAPSIPGGAMIAEDMIGFIDEELERLRAVMTERCTGLTWRHIRRLEHQMKLLSELRAMYENDLMPDEGM